MLESSGLGVWALAVLSAGNALAPDVCVALSLVRVLRTLSQVHSIGAVFHEHSQYKADFPPSPSRSSLTTVQGSIFLQHLSPVNMHLHLRSSAHSPLECKLQEGGNIPRAQEYDTRQTLNAYFSNEGLNLSTGCVFTATSRSPSELRCPLWAAVRNE